jgi:hypothetical protein
MDIFLEHVMVLDAVCSDKRSRPHVTIECNNPPYTCNAFEIVKYLDNFAVVMRMFISHPVPILKTLQEETIVRYRFRIQISDDRNTVKICEIAEQPIVNDDDDDDDVSHNKHDHDDDIAEPDEIDKQNIYDNLMNMIESKIVEKQTDITGLISLQRNLSGANKNISVLENIHNQLNEFI